MSRFLQSLTKLGFSWYFKEAALLDRSKYSESDTHTSCPWKGEYLGIHHALPPSLAFACNTQSTRSLKGYAMGRFELGLEG